MTKRQMTWGSFEVVWSSGHLESSDRSFPNTEAQRYVTAKPSGFAEKILKDELAKCGEISETKN
ncbi:7983_t:CDS:2 [Dentiscutata heterogama]|uniref:7983_t:CDS:1 n=1 Tax=Dentiscutata heterogama TaxID=1316150 RepID=A0ACA9K523_9GLOM|nr:7983_t:CDS:2 [Dentiscutata heterogama]